MIISHYDRHMRHFEQGRVAVPELFGADRVRYVYRELRRQGVSKYDARFTITSLLGIGRHSHRVEVTK